MSSSIRVGVVCEGPTDKIVIDGLIAKLLNTDDFVSTEIQPPSSALTGNLTNFGSLGGGWVGVRRWCAQATAGGVGIVDHIAFQSNDIVVVQLDADVAREYDLTHLNLNKGCPPTENTCEALRNDLTSLMGGGPLPPNLVFCIPSDSIEAWVIASIAPDLADANIPWECYQKPEVLLPRVRVGRFTLSKSRVSYQRHLNSIVAGWNNVLTRCSEAARFDSELNRVLT